MATIYGPFLPFLRDSPSQGTLECFTIGLTFSYALYLQTGDSTNLFRCLFSFFLISLKLHEPPALFHKVISFIQKIYWLGLIPVLYASGVMWSSVLLYSSLQAHLYFRMMEGMSKSFTVGELFLNSHALITIFEFSSTAADPYLPIIFFPVCVVQSNE